MIRRWAGAVALAAVVTGLAAAHGCADAPDESGSTDDDASSLGFVQGAEGPGGNFTIDVDFALGSCNAAVECKAGEHGAADSLLTALTCAYPDDNYTHDAILTFERRLRCYASGNLSDPSTWAPTGGDVIAPAALDEHSYSGSLGFFETLYYNTTQNLAPMDAYAFCHYRAMALLRADDNETATREVVHRDNPLRFNWEVVLEVDTNGSWDCHKEDNLSGVFHDFPRASTHGLPSNTTKLAYPVTHDWAAVEELTLSNATASWLGARLYYHAGSTFPAGPGPPDEYEWRDLWITDENGTPIDTYVDTTCARVDEATGELRQIGLLLRDNTTRDMTGALAVQATLGAERFECERNVTTGACVYSPYTGGGGEAICVAQVTPQCAPACVSGVCVGVGTCDCDGTGYSGTACETPVCTLPCLNGGTCDAPETCTCPAGYWDAQCGTACVAPNAQCLDPLSCDQGDGTPLLCSGCEPGYYGDLCDQTCVDPGHCAGVVTCAQSGGAVLSCDGCDVGYYDATCASACTNPDPGVCVGPVSCDQADGLNPVCDSCVAGSYGDACDLLCPDPSPDHCAGTVTCQQGSGSPLWCDGCDGDDWQGLLCTTPCDVPATCAAAEDCTQGGVTTLCDGCLPNYHGDLCDQACGQGHCVGDVTCDQADGANRTCTACADEFYGTDCEEGWYLSCVHALQQGQTTSGLYWLDPDGDGLGAVQAYCDQTTAGGGWMLMAKFSQSQSIEGFDAPNGDTIYRDWFGGSGDADGTLWIHGDAQATPTTPAASYDGFHMESHAWSPHLSAGDRYELRQHFYKGAGSYTVDYRYRFTFNGHVIQDTATGSDEWKRAWQLLDRQLVQDDSGITWDVEDDYHHFWLPFSASATGNLYTACGSYELSASGCSKSDAARRRFGNAGVIGHDADTNDPQGAWAPHMYAAATGTHDIVNVHQAQGAPTDPDEDRPTFGRSGGDDMAVLYWIREETCSAHSDCDSGYCSGGQCVAYQESCLALYTAGQTADGDYVIDPDGASGAGVPYEVTCDMTNGGWTLVAAEDFETGVTNGWDWYNTVASCGSLGQILWGGTGFGNYNWRTYKKFEWAPVIDHTDARVTLDFIKIDQWDTGDTGWVDLGYDTDVGAGLTGPVSTALTFTAAQTTQECGNSAFEYNEHAEPVSLVLPGHGSDDKPQEIWIRASSNLSDSGGNESFGLDNIKVWVK